MKPQYILHKLSEGFIITSSEEVTGKQGFNTKTNQIEFFASHPKYDEWGLKVIAQQDQINFSLLKEEEQKMIGYFDVEKLAKEWLLINQYNANDMIVSNGRSCEYVTPKKLIEVGFQKAQELLSDRRFTLEEVNKIFEFAWKNCKDEDESFKDTFERAIQSLSQPKSWKVIGNWENDKFKITKIL